MQPDTATIIAIGAAADLASRIFLAVLAIFIQMPSRYIYLIGALFTVVTRFGKLGHNNILVSNIRVLRNLDLVVNNSHNISFYKGF